MDSRPSFEEYLGDCAKQFSMDGDVAKAKKSFSFNMRAAQQWAQSSQQLATVIQALRQAQSLYVEGRPELLFYPASAIDGITLHIKSFESAIRKAHRSNVVFNRRFPKEPERGYIDVGDIYQSIDDLLRTRLICKYLDGPKFVCDQLEASCKRDGIEYIYRDLGTDAGYYAWHFYFKTAVEIMTDGVVSTQSMWVEIQLSTQLAEVITSLTHGLYEERRTGANPFAGSKWKWDANSPHFRSAFLGHGLHLLEGLIQTLKDDMVSEKPTTHQDEEAR